DRVGLRNLAKGESSLKDETAKAEADLMSDPAGIVFGEVVGTLVTELARLTEWLEGLQSGELVQESQKSVETTLEDLIAALEQEQKEQEPKDPQEQQQEQQQQEPEKINTAELKLLLRLQLRINDRTTDADQKLQEGENPAIRNLLKDLAGNQERVTRMADLILERIKKQQEDVPPQGN
ncbi:MAG: hypothetical protein KDC48_23060, partial [Planctomycetes bacterium]|nr:hypothetical protein [Planctomycetota bacterium]